MAIEIERKFLVRGDAWRPLATGVSFVQGYLSRDPDRTVRVRIAGEAAYLTIKGRTCGATRLEFEYPVPMSDARAMLDLADGPLIDKLRYRIPLGDLVWEVDEFFGENQGLILAEVELADQDQSITLPDWIAEEVTGDARYYNSTLAVQPYTRWTQDSR